MVQISRRDFIRLSIGAGAGLLFAGCATATPTPQPVPPTEAPKPAAPTEAPKPAQPTAAPQPVAKQWPRQNVPRERTFIRCFGYAGGVMDQPGNTGCYTSAYNHQHSGSFMLEGLAYFSAFANKTYPWLAESWEYNADATELTIHMRKGVEWSDGTPLTGKDLVFTINMLIKNAPKLRNSSEIAGDTKSVQLQDDYTVKLSLKETNYRYFYKHWTFRYDLGTYIVPEHIYKDVEDPLSFMFFDPAKGWPVVSGPYQPVEYDETHQYLDLRYDWWAEKIGLMKRPEAERITQVPMGNNEISAMKIVNDEVDNTFMLPASLMQSIISYAPQVTTHSLREKPYGYVDWWPTSMWFNCLEWPWDDPRVRWAVAYAIDQKELVEVGQQGCGYISNWIFPTYPPLMRYFEAVKGIQEKYNVLAVDPKKSEALMLEAGFKKDSEGFWAKDGKRAVAKIYASAQHFGDIAPLVVERMRAAGFDAAHLSPPDVWTIKGTTALLHFFGHGGSVEDPFRTMDYYHSRWVKPTGEDCGNNRCRWVNKEYDAIVEEMSRTPMDAYDKLDELVRKASEIWFRELPELPLVQFMHRIPYNTRFWKNWPTKDNPYINGADFHLTGIMLLWGGLGLQPVK